MIDPEASEDAYDIDISLGDFMELYYEPFSRRDPAVLREQMIEDDPYLFADQGELGVSLGIQRNIRESLAAGVRAAPADAFIARSRRTVPDLQLGGRVDLYRDGIAIKLADNWSDIEMQLSPEHRSR